MDAPLYLNIIIVRVGLVCKTKAGQILHLIIWPSFSAFPVSEVSVSLLYMLHAHIHTFSFHHHTILLLFFCFFIFPSTLLFTQIYNILLLKFPLQKRLLFFHKSRIYLTNYFSCVFLKKENKKLFFFSLIPYFKCSKFQIPCLFQS